MGKGKGLKRMKLIFLFMLIGFASMKTRSDEGNEPDQARRRGAKTGKGTKTDWAFCTKDKPCGNQEGDCDSDAECGAGLQCGFDNCKNFHEDAHRLADCCESRAPRLIEVTGNAESDPYTPANAVVDGGKDSSEPRPNYWLLPSRVKSNSNGKITYTFSNDITINGFYVRNTGGDVESGTQDFTIYVDDEIAYEGELPEPNGDQQLFRFPLKADMKAKSFSLVVKSFHGYGGGLQYFWYY